MVVKTEALAVRLCLLIISEVIHIEMANMTAPVWNWTRTSMDMQMRMGKAHEDSTKQKELQVIEEL